MKSPIIIILASLCVTGCFFQSQPADVAQPVPSATPAAVAPAPPVVREPLNAPVSFHEALARAIRHRLEADMRQMEKVLGETRFYAPSRGLLVKSSEVAGYTIQSAAGIARDAGASSPLPPEQTSLAADVAAAWNVLDMGMSYAQSRMAPQAPATREELRRKAAQNIIQEVQYAFVRAAGAESLMPRINTLLQRARTALQQIKDAPESDTPAYSAYQRELIDITRRTWRLAEHLGTAKTELAVLMNVPPGTAFTIAVPDWNRPHPLTLRKTMASLEDVALAHRTDLQSIAGDSTRDIYQIRQALLRAQPNLRLDPVVNASDEVAEYDRSWWNAGMQVALDLFNQYAGVSGDRDRGQVRLQTLQMAVVAQLHLARQRYVLALDQYRLSRVPDPAMISGTAPDAPPAEQVARLRKDSETLYATLSHCLAYAELENAATRFYSAMGMDPLPPAIESQNVPAVARSLESAMAQWPALMDRSQAAFYPDGKVVPELPTPPANAAAVSPIPIPAPASEPSPEPAASSRAVEAPQAKSGIIVNASKVRREGRRTAREVTIYRDVVNIHFAPDANSPVKGQGLIGETYPLLGWSPNGWLKIQMGDGSFGYVPTKYIKPVETETAPPADSRASEPKEATVSPAVSSAPKMIATSTRANIRAMPSLNSTVKYVADAGTRYAVRGMAGEWYKIRAKDGTDGWLHQSVVTVITAQ